LQTTATAERAEITVRKITTVLVLDIRQSAPQTSASNHFKNTTAPPAKQPQAHMRTCCPALVRSPLGARPFLLSLPAGESACHHYQRRVTPRVPAAERGACVLAHSGCVCRSVQCQGAARGGLCGHAQLATSVGSSAGKHPQLRPASRARLPLRLAPHVSVRFATETVGPVGAARVSQAPGAITRGLSNRSM
jgi:hypothetical protein